MRYTYTLGRLFDVSVGVHVSWFPVFVFMTASIAANMTNVPHVAAIVLASCCALFLFAGVIAHEFAHAFAARRYGVRTSTITLFLFGGVASLESEPPSPGAEVVIALAGPAMSAFIAIVALGLLEVPRRMGTPLGHDAAFVAAYIALSNGVLAVFNLLPAYPMDGGRVLRAAVWHVRKSRAAATGAASIVGLILAGGLVVGGTIAVIGLHAWEDIWYVLIGGFLVRQGWVQLSDSRRAEQSERANVRQDVERPALPIAGLANG